jgi:genome maintenance exonuclease 1
MKKTIIGNSLVDLPTEDIDGRRYYVTPEGIRYPSVTTALSEYSDKTFLQKWKDRIGEEEANKITQYACDVGTAVHSLIENYLFNKKTKPEPSPFAIHRDMMFGAIQRNLTKIDNIHALEAPLYSHTLRLAGRTDCIAEYDGKLSIIDFKTSKKEKKLEWIENYFIQGTIYSLMYEELTGLKAKNVVIILVTYDCEPFVWVQKRRDYFPQVQKLTTEVVPKLLL